MEHARQYHDSRAVLVIVKHGNIQCFRELLFNVKALGGGNVFQINATKHGGNGFYHGNNFIRVLGA